jgi:hypothetical protein
MKLKIRYNFVDSLTALLLRKEFIVEHLMSGSYSTNAKAEFPVNFSFLSSIFQNL